MAILENPGRVDAKPAPLEGIVLAAAQAYRGDNNSDLQPQRRHPAPEAPPSDHPPTSDHPPETNDEGDRLPREFQKKIDAVLTTAIEDGKNGKFSPEGKTAWQDLFDYMKKDQPAANQMAAALNEIGAGANQVLESQGSPNHFGIAGQLDANGVNYYMTISGSSISSAQNALDAAQDHESATVFKVGRLERPKPKAAPATP